MEIEQYQKRIDDFAKARDWDKFHNPKNLTMALAGEAGELLDLFQWLTLEESQPESIDQKTLDLVKEEIADVFIYLLRLSDKLNINLMEVVDSKLQKNESKYPVALAKGNAIKYTRRNL